MPLAPTNAPVPFGLRLLTWFFATLPTPAIRSLLRGFTWLQRKLHIRVSERARHNIALFLDQPKDSPQVLATHEECMRHLADMQSLNLAVLSKGALPGMRYLADVHGIANLFPPNPEQGVIFIASHTGPSELIYSWLSFHHPNIWGVYRPNTYAGADSWIAEGRDRATLGRSRLVSTNAMPMRSIVRNLQNGGAIYAVIDAPARERGKGMVRLPVGKQGMPMHFTTYSARLAELTDARVVYIIPIRLADNSGRFKLKLIDITQDMAQQGMQAAADQLGDYLEQHTPDHMWFRERA